MALKDAFLPEYDHEMGTTRRLLERVPEADSRVEAARQVVQPRAARRPHREHPALAGCDMDVTVFDVAPSATTRGRNSRTSVGGHPQGVRRQREESAREDRRAARRRRCSPPWTLKQGDHEILTMPKIAVLRSFIMNHLIHHRGQLSVYLRLRDVPLPAIYGPSADEG